jgi:hypothetical protein
MQRADSLNPSQPGLDRADMHGARKPAPRIPPPLHGSSHPELPPDTMLAMCVVTIHDSGVSIGAYKAPSGL